MTPISEESKVTQPGKVLYTARIHTTGGRENGVSRSSDGHLDIKLSTPGRTGVGTNPEQLFAAGWSACFEGAMGLAARGAIPFPSTFACFLARAYDFIRMAAISNVGIKMAGSHAGVSIGEDGPSQMALEDLAMCRAEPNITVLYPCDGVSTENCASRPRPRSR